MSDNGVQLLSDATKGIWIDMLCRMWKSSVRGTLPSDIPSLARLMGRSEEVMTAAVEELKKYHVFSTGAQVGERGKMAECIVNRRMYREHRLSIIKAEAGAAGGKASGEARRNKSAEKCSESVPDLRSRPEKSSSKALSKNTSDNDSNGNGLRENGGSKTEAEPQAALWDNREPRSQKPELDQPNRRTRGGPRGTDGPVSASSLFGSVIGGFINFSPEALVEEVVSATREPWTRDAWSQLLNTLQDKPEGLAFVEEKLRYVQSCQDPKQRVAKDLGELNNPAGYLFREVTGWCKRNGVRWPTFPAKPTQAANQ